MKKLVISQVGDSTDGEDQEELEATFQEDNSYISKLNTNLGKAVKKFDSFSYCVSYVLKDIGNRLLQTPEVRSEYKAIKQSFFDDFPLEQKEKLESLDKLLGKDWGTIINLYASEADREKNEILELQAAKYYAFNQKIISDSCSLEQEFNNLTNNGKRGIYYLNKVVKITESFKEVYKINEQIIQHLQTQRSKTEYFFNKSAATQKDHIEQEVENIAEAMVAKQSNNAIGFLARIKASKKLDRDIGKDHLYDNKYGTGKTISQNSIAKQTTQASETLEISTGGAFSHLLVDEGTYSDIGSTLKGYIDNKFIYQSKLKQFFQLLLKNQDLRYRLNRQELFLSFLSKISNLYSFY